MDRGFAMIVVDDLQLLCSHKRLDSRVQDVSEISRDLKIFAKDLRRGAIGIS